MRRPFRFAVVVAAIAMGPGGLSSQGPARAIFSGKLQSCSVAGFGERVLCGRYEVPESRLTGGGRTISLNVVVLPATTDSLRPDPLVFLAGGGVVPASRYAGFLARSFPRLRRTRDILLVDQRGTWGSNPLDCPTPGDGAGPPTVLSAAECRDALMLRADLRAYTTDNAMDDLDAVRQWLGYPQVNLYGVSYGTKAAQVYLRQHADRVRTAVLYGVVPVSAASQLDLARSAQITLEHVFRLCDDDQACHAAFPHLPAEFDSLLTRLTRVSARVTIGTPDGSTDTLIVTDRHVRNLVQRMLGSAQAIQGLPLLVHTAFTGDFGPIGRALGAASPPPPPAAPRGVFLSILCNEGIRPILPADVDAATAGTFFGAAPLRSQMEQCSVWPRVALSAGFWEPVRASTPVLALSGDLDPITPPAYAALVTKTLPNSLHILMPFRSHNDVDPCITSLFENFVLNGGADGLDTHCVAESPPFQFAVPLGR